jgi:cell division protein FtsN
MSRKWWVAALCVVVPTIGNAQSSVDSAAYKQAQSLVNEGNAAAGRAIVDSAIARAAPGTNAYGEGLYWRAVLSATAADAEMDYRRIIVDYALSPRVEDALLRLAQLELARADYDGALQHLNRLTLEHPNGVMRARAGYWTARVLFEKNDIPRACAANADALERSSQDDAELRNQISYLNQRCVGVAIATTPPTLPPTGGQPAVAVSDSTQTAKSDTSILKSAPVKAIPETLQVTPKPAMQVPVSPKDGKPTVVEGSVKEKTSSGEQDMSSGKGEYSVQIAAYNVKSQAQAMAAKLKKRGYEARVSGTTAPFRVRIGHYATQAQASAVIRSLKAKQINGFVVKAEAQ